MRDLLEVRNEIDVIDRQIVELYKQRMELAMDVGRYKIANGKAELDQGSDHQELETLSAHEDGDFMRQVVVELFEQIMSTSRKKQYKYMAEQGLMEKLHFSKLDKMDFSGKRIVCQGVAGAYSEKAMKAFFGEDTEGTMVPSWRDAMEAITSGRADYAVLPIENTTAGIIGENYDNLLDYDVCIIGEQIISIEHALLGLPGASLGDITQVYSHPQALSQCSQFLDVEHPAISVHKTANTAMAAQKVHDDKKINQAAIADISNAEIYGLKVLAERIQNEKGNATRFIIVSKQKEYVPTADKVSLSFELPHQKGSLYHILSHFIFNGLSMTKIESRPKPGHNWEYRFFIDFSGNLDDENVQSALRGLREESRHLHVIGNYKAFDEN